MFVSNIDECLNAIKEMNSNNLSTIDQLRKRIEELEDICFKDNKLQEMKQRLYKMQKDYWRGFPISEDEQKAVDEWKKKHDKEDHGYTPEMRMKAEGCCGGRYKYVFVPTSLGVLGRIVCHCGAEFVFQEIE